MNFVAAMMISTMKVATEPTALMTMLRLYPCSRSFWWWRTMPACDSVNDRNTPTAYSGISALVLPPNAMISAPAVVASTSTPFENTSRSPRLASCLGR